MSEEQAQTPSVTADFLRQFTAGKTKSPANEKKGRAAIKKYIKECWDIESPYCTCYKDALTTFNEAKDRHIDVMASTSGGDYVVADVIAKMKECNRPAWRDPKNPKKELPHRDVYEIASEALKESGADYSSLAKSVAGGAPPPATPADRPRIRYEHIRGRYWVENGDSPWLRRTRESLQIVLNSHGLKRKPDDPNWPSDIEAEIKKIEEQDYTDLAGEFAGWTKGDHQYEGMRILCTNEAELIEPKQGSCELILSWIEGLFGADYFDYVVAWLKASEAALREGRRRAGPAVIVAGPPGCSKTYFLNQVVVRLLGNRSGKCHQFLKGKTNFNDELIRATVWTIDDEQLDNLPASRRVLGQAVNDVASSNLVRLEPKGLRTFNLPIYRRLWLCMNDDDLDCLPEFADRLCGKVMLLRAYQFEMPDGLPKLPKVGTPEAAAFEARIKEELPHFVDALHNFDLPADLCNDRYGVKPVQHPELLAQLNEGSAANDFAGLLQSALFGSGVGHADAAKLELTADAIKEKMLSGRRKSECEYYARTAMSLGKYLGQLQDKGITTRHKSRNGPAIWEVRNTNILTLGSSAKEQAGQEF